MRSFRVHAQKCTDFSSDGNRDDSLASEALMASSNQMTFSRRVFWLPLLGFIAAISFVGCQQSETPELEELPTGEVPTSEEVELTVPEGTFGYDREFLRKYRRIVILRNGPARLLVVPSMQGRVMTSSSNGPKGRSHGWINYDLISSGKEQKQVHAFGGEDRFWFGPEGGQFAYYFSKGAEFTFENWKVPAIIDTEPWEIDQVNSSTVSFVHDTTLVNHSGRTFEIGIERTVRLMDIKAIEDRFETSLSDDLSVVCYQTENRITNLGKSAWTKSTGMPSIWILGMYRPSDTTTVVIPTTGGDDEDNFGPKINDSYFGKVPKSRLKEHNGIWFFKGDGKERGKIGISPKRSKGIAGSWDSTNNVLTIVWYNQPLAHQGYVNSMWEKQTKPFDGDVINSYNNGPPEKDAKPLGPFYELETSSPAAPLKPGQNMLHIHATAHLEGSREDLDDAADKLLGVDLELIEAMFEPAKTKTEKAKK